MADPTPDEVAFLALLSRGTEFRAAALELGEAAALKVPFNCILNGWVDRGEITKKGREVVAIALKPPVWEITIMPPEKR